MSIDQQSILHLNPDLDHSGFSANSNLNFSGAWTAAKNFARSSTVGQTAIATKNYVTMPFKTAEQRMKATSAYKSAASFAHKHPEILAAGLALAVVGDIYWARSDFASVAANHSLPHLINGMSTLTLGITKNAYLLKGAMALVVQKHGWEMMSSRPFGRQFTTLNL